MTTTAQANDLHFAVVIGIDRYPALTDLTSARNDAEKFREWLVDPIGGAVPRENVFVVEASGNGAVLEDVLPTQREVNAALKIVHGVVRERTRSECDAWSKTRLYIFVAGHGIAPIDGRGALLMADATPDELGLHVDLHKYLQWQEENGLFREVMIFADCCRVDSACLYAYGPPFTNEMTGRQSEVAVLGYATTAGHSARARLSGERRGLFTEALLEALRGNATNGEGNVTVDQIEAYVATRLDGVQTSEFIPRRNATVVVRVKPCEREVHLVFPRGDLLVELVHRDSTTEVLSVTEAEHVRWLMPGLYQVNPITPGVDSFAGNGFFRLGSGEGPERVEL